MRDVKIKNPEFLKLLDNISGLVDQVFDDKEFLDREHKLSFDHRIKYLLTLIYYQVIQEMILKMDRWIHVVWNTFSIR